jgi:capsid protein
MKDPTKIVRGVPVLAGIIEDLRNLRKFEESHEIFGLVKLIAALKKTIAEMEKEQTK